MKKHFKAIRTSIVLHKIYAWLFMILFVNLSMFFLYSSAIDINVSGMDNGEYIIPLGIVDNPIVSISLAILSVFLGIKVCMRLNSKAEMMKAILSIEENSRLTVELLTKSDKQIDSQN